MREYKRITLIMGHYGSGKTNIAVNMAFDLKKQQENTSIADLDIVNPYFRTKDSEELFIKKGIRLICSKYANSNVDIPALPDDIYSIIDDKSLHTIIDVGGDDRGAYALGRLSKEILEENNYEMLLCINIYRPLTKDAKSTIEVLKEIEAACKMKFTGIINNSNLGAETSVQDVLNSLPLAEEISEKTGLKLVMTTVKEDLFNELEGKIENLFPLKLQKNLYI